MTKDILLQLDDVHFGYVPERPILGGAALELRAGERVGLTGPIGCGKTTLLHVLVGLVKPDKGSVRAFGQAREKEADFHDVRKRVGLVFQDPDDQLFCPTVLEDVAFGPLNLGKSPEEARTLAIETLDVVGMKGFEDRITYKLSGGEKRLVSLATVLAMQPDVLLLDEPTTGLDEPSKVRIREVLRDLPQTMLIVSHEHEFVKSLATRIVRLENGRVIDDGSP